MKFSTGFMLCLISTKSRFSSRNTRTIYLTENPKRILSKFRSVNLYDLIIQPIQPLTRLYKNFKNEGVIFCKRLNTKLNLFSHSMGPSNGTPGIFHSFSLASS